MTSKPYHAKKNFIWHPNGKVVLFVALIFPCLVSLGFWQLSRAEEKRLIKELYSQNQVAPRASIDDLEEDKNMQYRKIKLSGTLSGDKRIFLDNKVRLRRPGYEVFEELKPEGRNISVLVNRGWVPASLDRSVLPTLEGIEGTVTLKGSLYRTLAGGLRLDDGIEVPVNWPIRVGWITAKRAEVFYQRPFYSYQLRLDRSSPGALETGWPIVSINPEKHIAYSVQWFLMSIVLILMGMAANSNLFEWLLGIFRSARRE
ncbi:MAG: hypothetical protein CBC09_05550 [Cellvibrionales bacterium TMED49]|nr:hypothetical protein [Porticoccaceae bacterium]OUU38456.1 MAG: hypothetical protein CBC09_05550 [Cellvibrionales bacterium TMED49]